MMGDFGKQIDTYAWKEIKLYNAIWLLKWKPLFWNLNTKIN